MVGREMAGERENSVGRENPREGRVLNLKTSRGVGQLSGCPHPVPGLICLWIFLF